MIARCQVCAEIRRLYSESIPIIMISANHDESSILEGLNVRMMRLLFPHQCIDLFILQIGSNDYVQKPFSRAQVQL